MTEVLAAKIQNRTAKVGVVGLGYVGLPLAVEFAKAGFSVTGIDLLESKVASINHGESYIQDIPTSVLRPLVESNKTRGHYRFFGDRATWTRSTSRFPRRCARPKIRT